MQRLTRGSVICFGSTLAGQFCLDTVFVVASAEPWIPADVNDLDVNEAFKTCTGHSITTWPEDAHLTLTLYRGATVEGPVEGMFSFVPARPADVNDPRFARPPIELPGFIDASIWRSTWGSKRPLPVGDVHDAWEAARDQVLEADLLLGVQLQTPAFKGREGAVSSAGADRQRC